MVRSVSSRDSYRIASDHLRPFTQLELCRSRATGKGSPSPWGEGRGEGKSSPFQPLFSCSSELRKGLLEGKEIRTLEQAMFAKFLCALLAHGAGAARARSRSYFDKLSTNGTGRLSPNGRERLSPNGFSPFLFALSLSKGKSTQSAVFMRRVLVCVRASETCGCLMFSRSYFDKLSTNGRGKFGVKRNGKLSMSRKNGLSADGKASSARTGRAISL